MNEEIQKLLEKIEKKGYKPSINLDRPIYLQPEDRIKYRSTRLIIILGQLNTSNGLSKKVIACVDFLLRNTGFQKKFILEYFKDQQNLVSKLDKYNPQEVIFNDFNIIQYKSVPWDLRFNDMFLYLKTRKLIKFEGDKDNLRFFLTEEGLIFFQEIKEYFPDEMNFLELFGKSIDQKKVVNIITDVIPNTYWRENEKLIYN